ncbi:hypothetical protein ACQ0MK_05515 [Thalassospira lucentensis]|uniref:hypothetical protein n=1 Tax=Thalassospira lucentensis TaxID=168935 RepID=UPI003D2EEE49
MAILAFQCWRVYFWTIDAVSSATMYAISSHERPSSLRRVAAAYRVKSSGKPAARYTTADDVEDLKDLVEAQREKLGGAAASIKRNMVFHIMTLSISATRFFKSSVKRC